MRDAVLAIQIVMLIVSDERSKLCVSNDVIQ